MLPVVLFLLALISICFWNRQLYAYFLRLAFYSLAHLWGSKNLGLLMLLLRFCESVSLSIIDFKGTLVFSLIAVKDFYFYRVIGFKALPSWIPLIRYFRGGYQPA